MTLFCILFRKLFLAVKFSKHDAKNVEARIESNGRIGGVTASTSKGVKQKLSAEEYREGRGLHNLSAPEMERN